MDDLTAVMWRAWPAAREERVAGGWVVRATPGVARRRGGCAYAAVASPDLDAVPADLVQVGIGDAVDRGLADRGWDAEADTDVLVDGGGEGTTAAEGVRVVAPKVWTPVWAALERRADGPATEREVLGRLGERARCLLFDDVAAGLLVFDEAWAGLFCVVVREDARRRGLAGAVLAAARIEAGPRRLYVQVERDNAPAQALWRGAGFEDEFAYRYRRRLTFA